jgi:hypothetical protein
LSSDLRVNGSPVTSSIPATFGAWNDAYDIIRVSVSFVREMAATHAICSSRRSMYPTIYTVLTSVLAPTPLDVLSPSIRPRITSSGTARLTTQFNSESFPSRSRSWSRRMACEALRGNPSRIQSYAYVCMSPCSFGVDQSDGWSSTCGWGWRILTLSLRSSRCGSIIFNTISSGNSAALAHQHRSLPRLERQHSLPAFITPSAFLPSSVPLMISCLSRSPTPTVLMSHSAQRANKHEPTARSG